MHLLLASFLTLRTKPSWSSVFLIWLLEMLRVGWNGPLIFFAVVSHGGMRGICFTSQERAAAFSLTIFLPTDKICERSMKLGKAEHSHLPQLRPAWAQVRLELTHSGSVSEKTSRPHNSVCSSFIA